MKTLLYKQLFHTLELVLHRSLSIINNNFWQLRGTTTKDFEGVQGEKIWPSRLESLWRRGGAYGGFGGVKVGSKMCQIRLLLLLLLPVCYFSFSDSVAVAAK